MKILTHFLSVIFVLLVTSCSNEMENTIQEGKLSFSSINASMADLPTSRAHLEGGGKVVWDVNDKVGIYSDTNTNSTMFTCTNVSDSNATFSSDDKVSGSKFFAYYPYENATIDGNTMTYTLSNTTEYVANTYFRQCPMIAQSSNNEFGFKHTCGIIRFSITGNNKNIEKLVLEGNNDELIAGMGTIDLTSANPVFSIPTNAQDASKTITLQVNEPLLQLTSTAIDFYFIVPAVEFTKGLSLTIYYFDEYGGYHCITKTTNKSVTISRSVMKSFSLFNLEEFVEQEEERIYAALMAFYNATGGENWTNKTNWGSNKPFSEWYGILEQDSRITGLSLSNNNILGELPKEIGAIESLTDISLFGNKLSGTIPLELANLRKLENLSISENKLTGELPKELGRLTSLKTLSLGNNNLSGSIPIEYGNLKNLELLSLGNNQLTGNLPKELGNLSSLEYLYLSHTNISGSIPDELVNLSKLKLLGLEFNELEGNIPIGINKLMVLEDLGLSNNHLTGNIPKEIGRISTLKRLHISDNKLSGTIPVEITDLQNLEILSFANNKLIGTLPEELVNLNKLSMFYVDGNMLNGVCSETLSSFIEDLDYYSIVQQAGYELKISHYYSSDFSRDGEVNTLQTHTKGNGVKIVITLDAFTDKEIGDGTAEYYIQKAYDAMFIEEPYNSLKEYFDVYSVLSVSTRNKIGTNTALETIYEEDKYSLNYDKVEEYAKKISLINSDISNTHVIVILNDGSYYRANCAWTTYGSISCTGNNEDIEMSSNIKSTINHELMGHGIGKLGDEYVEIPIPNQEYHYQIYPETDKQYLWSMHQQGYYINVDVTNDRNQIVWKDFLNNEDYVESVGIYEGAFLYAEGAYRPTEQSIMRDNIGGFNAPSRWAIYKQILEMAGETPTFEAFLEYDKKNLNTTSLVSARSISEKQFNTRGLGAPPCFIDR